MVDGEASKCNSRQTDSEDDEEHGKRCISDVASRNQTNSRKHESCIEQRSLSLGLEMLFRNVSVSFRSRENLGRSRSRSHLEQKTEGLGLNVSFYKLVFNDKSSLKLVLINKLSVGYSELHAVHAVSVSHTIDSLNSCIINHFRYLLINLMPPTIMQ